MSYGLEFIDPFTGTKQWAYINDVNALVGVGGVGIGGFFQGLTVKKAVGLMIGFSLWWAAQGELTYQLKTKIMQPFSSWLESILGGGSGDSPYETELEAYEDLWQQMDSLTHKEAYDIFGDVNLVTFYQLKEEVYKKLLSLRAAGIPQDEVDYGVPMMDSGKGGVGGYDDDDRSLIDRVLDFSQGDGPIVTGKLDLSQR